MRVTESAMSQGMVFLGVTVARALTDRSRPVREILIFSASICSGTIIGLSERVTRRLHLLSPFQTFRSLQEITPRRKEE